MTAVLPPARVAIAGNAPPSREWYRYFQASTQVNLDFGTLRHDVDALTVRVTALEDAPPSSGDIKITGTGSIYVSATAVKVVSLEGDAEDPGFTTYYGTNSTGAKGWYAVSDALASSGNIAKSTDAAGVTSFDLVDLADSGTGTALVKITRDAKGRISGTSAATTTDLAEGTNLYFTNARADARITLQKAQPLGLATLDAAGKLDAGQLPALAITETFVVNTQAAMLALSAQEGDVAVRTDLSKSFILTAAPASTLANWQELLTPMSPVTSVFGRTGSVTAASGDYTPAQVGAEPAIAAGTTAQYRRGDKTWRDFATDVRAAVLTGLSTATSAVITATDTVLGALGKLQAQITANLAALTGHTGNTSNPHGVTKAQVGLGNVDNTSDAAKPVSTAQAAALALKYDQSGGTIGGAGSGADPVRIEGSSPAYVGIDIVNLDASTAAITRLRFQTASKIMGFLAGGAASGGQDGFVVYDYSASAYVLVATTASVRSGSDNASELGTATSRWSVVYAGTGTINTSDAREKTVVAPLTAEELAAAADLSRAIGTYQWLESVQLKGADARHHAGLTVQQAIAIMQSHDLDPMRYGFICYDQWDELPEVVNSWPAQDAVLDDAGNVITPAVEAGSEITQEYRPAGDRYSFRHDELLLFIARGFAARLDALETAR